MRPTPYVAPYASSIDMYNNDVEEGEESTHQEDFYTSISPLRGLIHEEED
jgi:hypothetical protein